VFCLLKLSLLYFYSYCKRFNCRS